MLGAYRLESAFSENYLKRFSGNNASHNSDAQEGGKASRAHGMTCWSTGGLPGLDEGGAEHFVHGTEESHGFMISDYCQDKDGAVASMMLAELAAQLKAEGRTLHDYLESLYWQFGYHQENLAIYMEER